MTEEANIQEWDDEYDDETQTEYHTNMILIKDGITIKNACLWLNM
jgi:hypothetical protein